MAELPEITGQTPNFSHFDQSGQACMVQVGNKAETCRQAVASASVSMSAQAYAMLRQGRVQKGDVLGVARIAGIMAAKRVDQLIPLCHPLSITGANIRFFLDDARLRVNIEADVSITGRTGVEMEALTAASVAALTIYDMCKSLDKAMVISDIRLMRKSGGKSGNFVASPPSDSSEGR